MEILCCTDHNFVIPMGVMMHSLCINNSNNELHFHVFVDNSVTEKQKDELREVINEGNTLTFYLVDVSAIQKYLIVKVANFPIAIYYRLLLSRILPNNIHKILYLDADIIVRHDLSELWDTDITNYALAAVTDQNRIKESCERLGYDSKLGYFNSGVVLFNIDYFRTHNITDELIEFIKFNPEKLLCPDQDALNFVLKDNKLMLPVKYNVQENFYHDPPSLKLTTELRESINDPFILHFSTNYKPWNKKCHHPLRNLYYEYRKGTPWENNTYMEHFHHKRTITIRQQFNTWVMQIIKKITGKSQTIKYINITINH